MKPIKDLIRNKDKVNISGGRKYAIDEKLIEAVFWEVMSGIIRNLQKSDLKEMSFKKKVIYIFAVHPAISSEIWRNRERIIKNINAITGAVSVCEIKVK